MKANHRREELNLDRSPLAKHRKTRCKNAGLKLTPSPHFCKLPSSSQLFVINAWLTQLCPSSPPLETNRILLYYYGTNIFRFLTCEEHLGKKTRDYLSPVNPTHPRLLTRSHHADSTQRCSPVSRDHIGTLLPAHFLFSLVSEQGRQWTS